MDDPDARLDEAEPVSEGIIEAPAMPRPAGKLPYHEALAPELVDDLELAIGKGLALVEASEQRSARELVDAIACFIDAAVARDKRLPSDQSEAVLALGCLLGHALCRELGWGFAHVRRTRPPGIFVISRDRRYAAAPRAVVARALAGDGGAAVRDYFASLVSADRLPSAEPGRYRRLE